MCLHNACCFQSQLAVQGHPRSKFTVPIDSARVVSHMTSINTVIVSVTVFTIFDVQFWWPWSRPVQGHPGSKYIGSIESPLMGSYLTSFESNTVSVFIFEIFDKKVLWPRFRTGWFKVIQGQRPCCQSITHRWFSIRLLLTTASYLSPFLKHLTCNFNDLELGQSKVKGHGANRKTISGLLSDLHYV